MAESDNLRKPPGEKSTEASHRSATLDPYAVGHYVVVSDPVRAERSFVTTYQLTRAKMYKAEFHNLLMGAVPPKLKVA